MSSKDKRGFNITITELDSNDPEVFIALLGLTTKQLPESVSEITLVEKKNLVVSGTARQNTKVYTEH